MKLPAVSLLALSLSAALNPALAHKPVVPDVDPQRLSQDVKVLSSDEFEGRAPGTEGERRTLAYIAERFAAAGLQPGNAGSWFQDVPLVEIATRNPQPLVIGGPAAQIEFAYGADWVGGSAREDARIDLTGSELVFVGYGIVAPERGWNDYAGLDMRGKTAVILVNDPDWASETLDGPFGRAHYSYRLTSPLVKFDNTGFVDVRAEGRGRGSAWPMRVRCSTPRMPGSTGTWPGASGRPATVSASPTAAPRRSCSTPTGRTASTRRSAT